MVVWTARRSILLTLLPNLMTTSSTYASHRCDLSGLRWTCWWVDHVLFPSQNVPLSALTPGHTLKNLLTLVTHTQVGRYAPTRIVCTLKLVCAQLFPFFCSSVCVDSSTQSIIVITNSRTENGVGLGTTVSYNPEYH